MNERLWRMCCLSLLALVLVAIATLPFLDLLRRQSATGNFADAVESLRAYGTPEAAIVLFRAEHHDGNCEFTPASCLRFPKGDSGFDWKRVSVFGSRDAKHCQGAIAFARADGGVENVAFIYDGIVGLPTDFGTTVTLAEYLAANGEASGAGSE